MKDIYAVIGNPIAHSRSPFMHNAWFEQEAIEATYLPFKIDPSELHTAVEGMKALGIKGWNVTIPFKESMIPFLDELDASATHVQAVNTVVFRDGKWIGYNTDGVGFVESLKTKRSRDQLHTANVLIIGAGGASKGITAALLDHGVGQLTVANRTKQRAVEASRIFTAVTPLSIEEAEAVIESFDIVINTTSVGMSPDTAASPVTFDRLKQGALVADIIYNPLETALLKKARDAGAETLNGVGMFVHQGAIAFRLWTGQIPDHASAEKKLTALLGGTPC